jgi:two-component system response regulator HydG
MPGHVLIADGDPGVLAGLAAVCRKGGWVVTETATCAEALALAREQRPDLCLVDLDLEGGARALLEDLSRMSAAPAVVYLASLGDVPTAVEAMRAGAADFLEKPVRRQVLEAVLERALRGRAVLLERDSLREQVALLRTGPVVGSSPALRELLALVDKVAATPRTTVLIQGESGVGKELVARLVHQRSPRAQAPFVVLDCAALSEPLLEAELFGYEPGAFTGSAPGGHDGLLAAAEGGTLLLDEVGELAPALQAKLLRVLQERSYRRVGASRDLPADVRIVAATNRDLDELVDEGRFREDLFYRLNVLSLTVPPLRERREDVPALAAHFLRELAAELGKPLRGFTDEALEELCAHPWPGNVRQLRNTIERAALVTSEPFVRPEHLALAPAATGPAPAGERPEPADGADLLPLPPGERTLRAAEEALIRRVLDETGGNRSRSARLLGINRTTLYDKLRRYGIEV